jgi:hypothetical protein
MGAAVPLKNPSEVTRWLQLAPRCRLTLQAEPFSPRVPSKCGTPGFPCVPTEVELLPWGLPSDNGLSGILGRYRGVKRSFRLQEMRTGRVATYPIPRADGISVTSEGVIKLRLTAARVTLSLMRVHNQGDGTDAQG